MAALPAPIHLPLVDGTTVVVPDSLELLTTYILQEQGDWFEDEIKFLRQLLQPGQVVIDIGANYGVYALSLARCVGPQGQVWAFEPASDTASFLANSIRANRTDWLQLVPKAVSDHEGSAWLSKPGQSELNHLVAAEESMVEAAAGEQVSLTTLDACMDRFGWRAVDLLKIDAEGEEERILEGGKRFFQITSPLVMFELKEGNRLHLELLETFHGLGYKCYRLVPGLAALVPFEPGQPVDAYLLNLFAAKPDRASALAAAGWLVEEEPRGPADLLQSDAETLMALLQALPYAQGFASLWSAAGNLPGGTANQEALAAWCAAHDPSLPGAQRLGALRRSEQLLNGLVQGDGPPSRLASLARVAMELGERQKAVAALAQLSAILQQGGASRLDEPFLSPHPATDAIPPGDTPALWLEGACLEAQSRLESYSSFFTGPSDLPRVRRLSELGWPSAAMGRKLALLEGRFPQLASAEAPSPAAPAQPGEASVRPWFDLLELERPLRCLDGGAMGLEAKPEPWVRWAEEGCAEVIGFEPLEAECDRLNRQVAHLCGAVRYLPLALGDGEEHTLHITNAPMTSSLFAPARATVDLFPSLGEYMQVEKRELLRTHRLDGLEGLRPVDFLKLDVQGAELMVLQGAQATLADITVVQCEVEFVELYEGQPLMADVDAFLRSQGFGLLKFAPLKGRPFKPLRSEANPLAPISQILWTDAIYVKDFRQRAQWSEHQLKAAAFLLHELYDAFDLVSLLLSELDARQSTDWRSLYLASVLLSHPALGAG